jgi:hypothetical protein
LLTLLVRYAVTTDELQHDGAAALGLFETVDGADARMIQCRKQLGLALESGEPIGHSTARRTASRSCSTGCARIPILYELILPARP